MRFVPVAASKVVKRFQDLSEKRVLKILEIQAWVVAFTFLALLVFIAYGVLPNRWYRILLVYSGSMSPTIQPGDLIIITRPPEQIREGMVLTFQVNEQLVTHRLIGFKPDGQLITKGDANRVVDDWSGQKVSIRGVHRATIPYLGYIFTLPKNWLRILQSGSWFSSSAAIQAVTFQTGISKLTPTRTPPGQSGTSLQAYKTAQTRWQENAAGQTFLVFGQICVMNGGEHATQGLTLFDQVEIKPRGEVWQPLPGANLLIAPEKPLEAGEVACFAYEIQLPYLPATTYRNTVQVTILNHSGWLPGGQNCPGAQPCPFGPRPRAEVEPPALNSTPTTSPTPTASATLPAPPRSAATPTPTPSASPTGLSPTIPATATGAATLIPTDPPAPSPTPPDGSPPPTSSPLPPSPIPTDPPAPSPTPPPTSTPQPSATLPPPQPTDTPQPSPTYAMPTDRPPINDP